MSKFKVYVADYEYESLENEKREISKLDADFVAIQCKTEDEVISKAKDADALFVQYAPITDKVFENLKNLKVIIRYGVGVDCVDLESATKHNVYVCNVPDYSVDEVSTHAVTLILTSLRKIQLLSSNVKNGVWDYKISMPIHRMSTLTLGIAGFGRIPRQVAKKANAFGFNIIAYDPFVSEEVIKEYGASKVDFDTLIKNSDIVTIHIPLIKETLHLFNKDIFLKMKKGAYIINTSRGPLIDEKALIFALDNGIIAGAALDVCEKEPIQVDNKLKQYVNVIITPHVAWYSEEAQVDLQRKAGEEVVRVLSGDKPLNCVNIK
ncbi:C-terminal binding protein [Clostridium psychrophilum]|uniref:C-terminal binding protein n=1 Tax=Clostridium psychrophilum TaxID=132926 RepID=UPI001C0CF7D1|nr:C-terminal binding protein [Clostridium psychrophilum]MBU3182265.1 C-terminal binding protein [Clostridium psychrophilum]